MSTLSVVAFPDEASAERMLTTLRQLKEQNLIQIDDAAMVTRKQDGKPKIRQLNNMVGIGALGGAFWGLLFGLLFLVPVLGLAVGAGIGALTGAFTDIGIDDKFIKKVSEEVQPGQTALFLYTHGAVMDKVVDAVKQHKDARLLQTSLSKEDEAKLRETLAMPS